MHTPSRNGFVLRQGGWRGRGQARERGRGGGGRQGVTLAHARITGGGGKEGCTGQGITFTFAWVAGVAFAFDGALPALAPILGLEMCPWNVPADMHRLLIWQEAQPTQEQHLPLQQESIQLRCRSRE